MVQRKIAWGGGVSRSEKDETSFTLHGKGTLQKAMAPMRKLMAVCVALDAIRLQLEQVFAEGYGYCLRTVGRAEFFIQFVKVLLYPAFRYSEQCGDVFV